jgi:ABC-2 type transport system ATP-binding protein
LIVTEVHAAVPALLAFLQQEGHTLSLLTTHHATLEDVFVRLTGRHLRDG